jgi:hypothetical protein
MVRDYGVPEEQVGDRVGLIAAGLFLGQALTSYYPVCGWAAARRVTYPCPGSIPGTVGRVGRRVRPAARDSLWASFVWHLDGSLWDEPVVGRGHRHSRVHGFPQWWYVTLARAIECPVRVPCAFLIFSRQRSPRARRCWQRCATKPTRGWVCRF